MISTRTRSTRSLFAVSIGCFAGAGVASDTAGVAPTIGATALAVAGIYALARYARLVSRRRLALTAIGCWAAFLAAAGLHAINPATIASIVPGPTSIVTGAIAGLTWATLLSACATTAFLGFREYGSGAGHELPEEQVLDGETSSEY